MLNRSIAAIKRWFSLAQITRDPMPLQMSEHPSSRRHFFKRAAVGAISVTSTAGLAKLVVDSVEEPDGQNHYVKDSRSGEQELLQREYVLMSDQEKMDMVEFFIDHHSNQA